MHAVVSSSPIVMHIFQILLYQHKLVHTSMYWSILGHTCMYLYILFSMIWYHAMVHGSTRFWFGGCPESSKSCTN